MPLEARFSTPEVPRRHNRMANPRLLFDDVVFFTGSPPTATAMAYRTIYAPAWMEGRIEFNQVFGDGPDGFDDPVCLEIIDNDPDGPPPENWNDGDIYFRLPLWNAMEDLAYWTERYIWTFWAKKLSDVTLWPLPGWQGDFWIRPSIAWITFNPAGVDRDFFHTTGEWIPSPGNQFGLLPPSYTPSLPQTATLTINLAGFRNVRLGFCSIWKHYAGDPYAANPPGVRSFDGGFHEAGLEYSWLGEAGVSESREVIPAGFKPTLQSQDISLTREISWSPGESNVGVLGSSATMTLTGDEHENWSYNPWDPSEQTLKLGDEVRVVETDTEETVFAGAVSSLSSESGSRSLAVSAFDMVDQLNQQVKTPGLLSRMSTPTGIKWCGLSDVTIIDHVLRECGFESTPNPVDAALILPLQGSAWPIPEYFGLVSASESADPNKTALFRPCSWGRMLIEGKVLAWGRAVNFTSGVIQLGFMTQHNGLYPATEDAHVRISFQDPSAPTFLDEDFIQVRVTPTKIIAEIDAGGTVTPACELDRNVGGWQHVSMTWDTVTGDITLSDGDQLETGTVVNPTSAETGGVYVEVYSEVLSVGIGGVYVLDDEPNLVCESWVRTAFLHSAWEGTNERLEAWKSTDTTALAIIKSHAEALKSAAFLGADGRFYWWDVGALLAQTPVTTLTAKDNLLNLPWSHDVSEAKKNVLVRYRPVSISRGWTGPTVTLWQAGGITLRKNEVQEVFATPSADEQWFSPVSFSQNLGSNFNYGHGSFVSSMIEESGEDPIQAPIYPTVSLFDSGESGMKITFAPSSTLTDDQVQILKAPEAPPISPGLQGTNLPILRGYARAEWTEQALESSEVNPAGILPQLEHDAGMWVQNAVHAQELADLLADFLVSPLPRITGVDIIPEMSLEVGQVVWLQDEVNLNVCLKVLITKITISDDGLRLSQSVSGIVIESEELTA